MMFVGADVEVRPRNAVFHAPLDDELVTVLRQERQPAHLRAEALRAGEEAQQGPYKHVTGDPRETVQVKRLHLPWSPLVKFNTLSNPDLPLLSGMPR